MQEIAVKKQEIVKINGKRVLVNGDRVKVLSKEDEQAIVGRVLDTVYAQEIGLYTNLTGYPVSFDNSQAFYYDLSVKDSTEKYRVYPKFIRPVIKPENYGIKPINGAKYYVHFDGEKALLLEKDISMEVLRDITDDIIDGKLIK